MGWHTRTCTILHHSMDSNAWCTQVTPLIAFNYKIMWYAVCMLVLDGHCSVHCRMCTYVLCVFMCVLLRMPACNWKWKEYDTISHNCLAFGREACSELGPGPRVSVIWASERLPSCAKSKKSRQSLPHHEHCRVPRDNFDIWGLGLAINDFGWLRCCCPVA